tara:strand:+ start:5068 stop:6708 length:1641 start_codon:yes stop_codon:yes gene_type:complete
MITTNILRDYVNNNKIKFIMYFIVIITSYPLESILVSNSIGKLSNLFKDHIKHKQQIIRTIIILSLGWFISKFSHDLKKNFEKNIYPDYYKSIREYLFKNIIYKYRKNFKELELGNILSKIIVVPYVMKTTLHELIRIIIPSVFTALFINLFIGYKSKELLLVTLSAPIMALVAFYFIGTKCIKYSKKTDDAFTELNEKLKDKFENLFSIYTNNNETNEIKIINELNDEYIDIVKEDMGCGNRFNLILTAIQVVTFIGSILVLYWLLIRGKITSGDVITIIIMLTYYYTFINRLSNTLPVLSNNIGILMNAEEFLKNITADVNKTLENNSLITDGNIRIIKIHFRYNLDTVIFSNLSCKFEPNKLNGIYGPSGCGKSTLVKLILGFYKLQSGNILIDGVPINKFDISYLRDNISYVNQNTKLFNKTILENIKYGVNIESKEVINIIDTYKLNSIFANLNNGILSKVGVSGSNLSGGQKQTILIIKAFLKKCPIYILDEPTAALDEILYHKLIKLIKELGKNKTVIIISHDNRIKKELDNIIYLKGK